MKNILLYIISVMALGSCSTLKYSYYFDHYSTKNTLVKDLGKAELVVSENALTTISKTATISSFIPIQEQLFTASVRKGTVRPSQRKMSDIDYMLSLKKMQGVSAKSNGEIKEMTKPSPQITQEGDKRKNGFAIAGFIFSLVYFLCIPAVIFSAIGLKSEKRKLAIAGIIIGLASIAGLLIFFLFFAFGA